MRFPSFSAEPNVHRICIVALFNDRNKPYYQHLEAELTFVIKFYSIPQRHDKMVVKRLTQLCIWIVQCSRHTYCTAPTFASLYSHGGVLAPAEQLSVVSERASWMVAELTRVFSIC